MTCIVTLESDCGVYMAGDFVATNGHRNYLSSEEKVFSVYDFLIGYTGSFRLGDILKYNLPLPLHPPGEKDKAFIVRSVVPTIIDTLKDCGFNEAATFILCYRGTPYLVQDDFSVLTHDSPIVATGSGGDVALDFGMGLLYGKENVDHQKEIQTILEYVQDSVCTVSGVGSVWFQEKPKTERDNG